MRRCYHLVWLKRRLPGPYLLNVALGKLLKQLVRGFGLRFDLLAALGILLEQAVLGGERLEVCGDFLTLCDELLVLDSLVREFPVSFHGLARSSNHALFNILAAFEHLFN